MQFDATAEFRRLQAQTALDATHPGATVHAFDAPVRAGVSPGNQAAEVEQVELQRV
jgi:hypothetical protein